MPWLPKEVWDRHHQLKQETLEEDAEKHFRSCWKTFNEIDYLNFGAKWQAERSYSEEEVLVLLHKRDKYNMDNPNTFNEWQTPKEWFNQFKKK